MTAFPRRRGILWAAGALALLTACASSPAAVESASSPGAVASVPPRVVALGDSFTAGFGYYDDGVEWDDLFACTALEETPLNNACASNSTVRSLTGELNFAPDYGFANQVSWAAQVATGLGITAETAPDLYANLAITGSTAKEWADNEITIQQLGGANGLDAVASLRPDIVLMTLGGNPSLGKILTGGAEQCQAFDKPVKEKELADCFTALIAEDATVPALRTVYTRLLDTTEARIVVLTYPQVLPQIALTLGGWSSEAVLVARQSLNDAVMEAVNAVRNDHYEGARLVTADPQFTTGLPPGDFTSATDCFGPAKSTTGTDGPSNQSTPTQELYGEDYAESGWCAGQPWLISSDTGAHPNVAGYAEFARVALAALGRG